MTGGRSACLLSALATGAGTVCGASKTAESKRRAVNCLSRPETPEPDTPRLSPRRPASKKVGSAGTLKEQRREWLKSARVRPYRTLSNFPLGPVGRRRSLVKQVVGWTMPKIEKAVARIPLRHLSVRVASEFELRGPESDLGVNDLNRAPRLRVDEPHDGLA